MEATTVARSAAGLMAVIALAACGTTAATSAPAASRTPAAAAGVSCRQQYEAWKQSARPEVKKMEAALKRVQSASAVEDIPAITTALHRAGRAAAVLAASYPVPRCADPRGYYALFLGRITAAGDNAKAGSGLSALILAEVPLQGVVRIENRLGAELNRTVGRNH